MDRLSINLRRIAVFAVIFILVLVIIDFNNRLEELDRLQKQDSILQAVATQELQTHTALQTQVGYATSDQAVQDWARQYGHYIQPGDQAVIPVGSAGGAPAQQTEATPSPTLMPNWQIWWNLFFGSQ
ncbi:MAG TPA: hypothetical protein VLZ89_02025 [Anaerolineales bacterium]|nr:hypothetical protein [Anaerolineales bacterium]